MRSDPDAARFQDWETPFERLFDELDVHRVQASIDPDNVPSARVLEGLAFEYEGTAVSAVPVRDMWVDDARYGLTAEGHETLLVSWAPGAGGPEPFYLARGFVPTGAVEDGEIHARLTL